jgi:hypothetical protein
MTKNRYNKMARTVKVDQEVRAVYKKLPRKIDELLNYENDEDKERLEQ